MPHWTIISRRPFDTLFKSCFVFLRAISRLLSIPVTSTATYSHSHKSNSSYANERGTPPLIPTWAVPLTPSSLTSIGSETGLQEIVNSVCSGKRDDFSLNPFLSYRENVFQCAPVYDRFHMLMNRNPNLDAGRAGSLYGLHALFQVQVVVKHFYTKAVNSEVVQH